jgi:hypothetical protein
MTMRSINQQFADPTGRTASYVFATADALSSDKAQANQVLTGTADNVYVSAALTAGYKVIVFLGVTATFANTVTLLANGTIIQANGVKFNNNASTPLFADGGKTGCVFRDISTDAGGLTVNLANTTLQNVTLGSYFVGLSVPNSLSNTIFGQTALYSNTTGSNNSAFGQAALQQNTTGYQNSAFGQAALYSNTTGSYNNAFGRNALQNNTTGYQNNAFGTSALQNNTTGQQNSAFGQGALQNNTTGQQNSAFGQGALQNNTTGNNNLGLGYYAGLYNTTTSNQLFINTLDQGSYANDVSNSLIYGIFNATPASQTLSLNAGIINMKYIPSADPHALGQIYQVLATHVLMVSNG